jgi:glycosyltransferase involved in cell wall biosynthesis
MEGLHGGVVVVNPSIRPPQPAPRQPQPGHILSLGRLEARKGFDMVIRALPSLPGALYHQFGAIGLAVGSALLGATVSMTLRVLSRFPRSLVALGAFLLAVATLALSPELAAFDFLAFASVAVGFLVLSPFERYARRSPTSRRIPTDHSHAQP